MPQFLIPEKDTDLCFHLPPSNPKFIEIWERYEGLKFLKGVGIGGHEFVRFCNEWQRECGDDEGDW